MPLTGRSEIIEQCLADITEGRSVLLRGARGSGKTSVLDAVAHHLDDASAPVWRIAGADGTSDVPLAPFAGMLARLSLATLAPPRGALPSSP